MRWAVFDIETRIDKRLVNESIFRRERLDDEVAFERYRERLVDEQGHDFVPLSFHVPVSIAIATVAPDYALESLATLAEDTGDEVAMVREFWAWIESFPGQLVSFNGRGFDLPVLELQALRHGCAAPRYFGEARRYRARGATHHLDLQELVTNSGAYRVRGGFDVLQRIAGLDGKGEIDGSKVQEYWEAGRLDDIHRYCRLDVLQTYRLFLRIEVVRGRLDPARAEALDRDTEPFRERVARRD